MGIVSNYVLPAATGYAQDYAKKKWNDYLSRPDATIMPESLSAQSKQTYASGGAEVPSAGMGDTGSTPSPVMGDTSDEMTQIKMMNENPVEAPAPVKLGSQGSGVTGKAVSAVLDYYTAGQYSAHKARQAEAEAEKNQRLQAAGNPVSY